MLVDPVGNRLGDRHKYRINQQIESGRNVSVSTFRIRFTALAIQPRTYLPPQYWSLPISVHGSDTTPHIEIRPLQAGPIKHTMIFRELSEAIDTAKKIVDTNR